MDEAIPQKRKRVHSESTAPLTKKNPNSIVAEDDGDSDDCQILEKTIPMIVLDNSDAESCMIAGDGDGDEDGAPIIINESTESDATTKDEDTTTTAEDATTTAEDTNETSPEPLIRLHFRDKDTFSQLKNTIHQAIRDALFKQKKTVQIDEHSTNFELTVCETTSTDACVFMVDANPNREHSKKANKTDVPQYSVGQVKVLDHTIPIENVDDSEECRRNVRPKSHCFNCDGDHNMRDCKEPKDMKRIRENRAQFSSTRTERYHVDLNQRFGQFVPGELSESLREALRLRVNEVPLHVYRMRVLGYPPGWLEDAKVAQSGLTMFDDQTTADQASKDDELAKYDLDKIVSYPGFNVDPAPGFYDMCYNLRLPPMSQLQCKAVMMESLRGQSAKSYRRQKVKVIPMADPDGRKVDLTNIEMDLDDGEIRDEQQSPASPEPAADNLIPFGTEDCSTISKSTKSSQGTEDSSIPATTDSPASPTSRSKSSGGPTSPSLDDLKKQQELLLAALDDSTVSQAPDPSVLADDSLIDDILALDTTQSSCGANETLDNTPCISPVPTATDSNAEPVTPANTTTTSVTFATPSTPITPMNSSKHSVSGTPLIKSVSPFNTLPVGSCWSAGVSDVIDFENLADSTGKFEKMKKLIDKVRVTVKELNDEYEH